MKVVVSTPTGHVGSRVVQLLIQAGVRPTLLAHHPARLDPAVRERADVVEADVSDAATVLRATRDADALFWLSPPNFQPAADPVAWYARLGANAARAVAENRIGRTVFLSSIGAEKRSGAGEIDGLGPHRGVPRRHRRGSAPPAVPEDKRSFVTTTPTTLAAWVQSYLRPALLSTG